MKIEYGFRNDRGFTQAKIKTDADSELITVYASSAINYDASGNPSLCLRYAEGMPMEGSSYVWLSIKRQGPTEESVSVQLNRKETAQLVGILTRWLTAGFIQGDLQ